MFKVFETNFRPDLERRHGNLDSPSVLNIPAIPGLRELAEAYGGVSFNNGLYRIIHAADFSAWQERALFAFPDLKDRVHCFGYDWIGRAFAIDTNRLEDGQPGVLMLEPGTGEALQIPCNLVTFHNAGLVDFGDAALSINFHRKWLASGGKAPSYTQCAGYKVPLFLGGVDDIENIELADLDVYWHLMGQLILKTRGLPPGARVRVNS